MSKIARRYGVDDNWLLRGEGTMYRRPPELLEPLTSKERTLLDNYRVSDLDDQDALYSVSRGLAKAHK